MHDFIACQLAELYEKEFGGKERGRFRISLKLLQELAGRRRLYTDDIQIIGRELFERGYVLIDMESFFAVLSQKTLTSYRRVNTETLCQKKITGQSAAGREDSPNKKGGPRRRPATVT